MRKAFAVSVLMALSGLLSLSGCKRGEDAFDNRTLEQRPHVETVKPVDRTDPFRP
jgi:hypothetical protein